MTKSSFYLLAALALAFFSCKESSDGPGTTDPVPVENVAELARMNRELGWKIFNEEQEAKPDENVLISPLSIQTALFMAHNGARGNTLEQMLAAAACPGCSVSDLNRLHRDLITLLTEQSGHPTLTLANGFFYDKNRVNVKPPFLQTLDEYYDGGSDDLDFNAEQAALQEINGWVKTHTNGKIEKILDKITPLDVAFLINALHFKADWATGFAPESTRPGVFTKPNGSKVTVDFVNADRSFTFAQLADFNLVDIPFRDSTFSLSFIQPSATNAAAGWHRTITADGWTKMYESAKYERADVSFPKLKLSFENDLIQTLKALGVQDAFSETAADFTDMGTSTAGKNIFINQIKHKAVLEVDEKGAEGAAVTSIGFGITSVPPTFRFDSPFVLVLRHVPTNSMVFAGYVADPEF